MSTFGERLNIAVRTNGMRPAEFCRRAKISDGQLYGYIRGEKMPRLLVLQRIVREAGVDCEWLVMGPR